jgi:hypothetical protein
LPLRRLFKRRRRDARRLNRSLSAATKATCRRVLRAALRQRRNEKRFQELRYALINRRGPREQSLQPRIRRRRRRARAGARSGVFNRRLARARGPQVYRWGLYYAGEFRGTKYISRRRLRLRQTALGELLDSGKKQVKRDRRAMYGFNVHNKRVRRLRRRLRRKYRDS